MRFFLVGSLVLATASFVGAQTFSVPVHPRTHLTEAPESLAVSLPSEQGSFLPAPADSKSIVAAAPAALVPASASATPPSGTVLIGAACILLASAGTLRHLLRRESDGFRVAKGP